MPSYNVFLFVDYIIIALGLYIFYSGIKCKREGHLSAVFLPQDSHISDMKGMVDYCFPRIMIFGAICLVYGVFGFIVDKFIGDASKIVTGISTLIFIIFYVWFSVMLRKAREKYK